MEIIRLPYDFFGNPGNDHADGDQINYLEIENVIFVPVFDLAEDIVAIRIIKTCFPNQKIIPIESNELAKNGGILNCISWTIRRD
ncbi:agmatine deiminase family protein [Algoriphagus sp. AK58]|uniref:agmatine deiminase family protein n=1 Tax=Algoriphagus sp. AK58 TaxID=1406877 RepID=UPI00164F8CC3|nr:agmatine deiminase family protein [Algoriphagus sp. AK58]